RAGFLRRDRSQFWRDSCAAQDGVTLIVAQDEWEARYPVLAAKGGVAARLNALATPARMSAPPASKGSLRERARHGADVRRTGEKGAARTRPFSCSVRR